MSQEPPVKQAPSIGMEEKYAGNMLNKSFLQSLRSGPYEKITASFGVPGAPSEGRGGLRAWSTSRVGNYGLAGCMLGTLTILMGPWIIETDREFMVHNYQLKDPDLMPLLSNAYWINEWRKGGCKWRRGGTLQNFWAESFLWCRQHSGRDVFRPSTWFKATKEQPKPAAFVPMCGDSPIVGELAKLGYEVDAVDVADAAVRSLVEHTEKVTPRELFPDIHIHLDDIFGSEFWRGMSEKKKKFDVIWDRQGLSAVNVREREDYAFLLRRALKDDGVILIEATYRTPMVSGNKYKGPPFDISEEEIEKLFPAHDGFTVKCQEVSDKYLGDFGPEGRVTGKVYKEFWDTQFPCVAWRTPGKRQLA